MTSVACSRCGKQEECDEDSVPLGWSLETDRGRVIRYCAECIRDNIRNIESKLPEEWWG